MEEQKLMFQSWCVVELFGHNQLAGLVSEQTIAGKSMVRIDVPATKKCPAFTKYHNPDAVYGITPVDEDYATRMADKIEAQPINNYNHNEVINEMINDAIKRITIKPLL